MVKKIKRKGHIVDTINDVAMVLPCDTGHEELVLLSKVKHVKEAYRDPYTHKLQQVVTWYSNGPN